MPVLGIDLSHHNGEVDFDAVARSSVRFCYLKATEGATRVDPRFATNWAALGTSPLLRSVYHYARPDRDPIAQAAHFAATVGDLTGPRVLPPALDLESDGMLAPDQVIDWVRAFVSTAEQLVRREMIIYTGGLWRRVLGDPLVPELGTRMLWTARWGTQEPVVPRTWARWDFWQFTNGESGDVQTIPGIKGPVDCSRWRGSLAELQTLAEPPPFSET